MQIEVLPQPPLLDHHHNFVESWSRDLDLHTSLWQSGIFQSHANSARYIHGQPIIGNEINIVYNHLLFFTEYHFYFFLFFFFLSVYLKLDLPSVPPSSNQWNVASEMAKPVQPAVLPENGRGELPDERDNEIVIELDRENQYGRTQPRANEPQGNHLRNIQMVHPHLMSPTHFFFFFFVLPFPPPFLLFIQSLSITRTHTSSIFLPSSFSTRFQSSDRYTGYPSSFSWPNFFFYPRSIWL